MPIDFTHLGEPIDRGGGLMDEYVHAMDIALRALNTDHEIGRWASDGPDAAECERVHRHQALLLRATVASRSSGTQKAVVRTEVFLDEHASSWRRAYIRVDRKRLKVAV